MECNFGYINYIIVVFPSQDYVFPKDKQKGNGTPAIEELHSY